MFLIVSESSTAADTDQEGVSINNYAGLNISLESIDGAMALIKQPHDVNGSVKIRCGLIDRFKKVLVRL